jgi:hypothetical protein
MPPIARDDAVCAPEVVCVAHCCKCLLGGLGVYHQSCVSTGGVVVILNVRADERGGLCCVDSASSWSAVSPILLFVAAESKTLMIVHILVGMKEALLYKPPASSWSVVSQDAPVCWTNRAGMVVGISLSPLLTHQSDPATISSSARC